MKFSNIFIVVLSLLFFYLGYAALQEAKPQYKNERVYNKLKPYIPYYLEKRVGGFSILKKGSSVKEKPPITDVYQRLEQLEQGWAKENLKLKNNTIWLYEDGSLKCQIKLKTQDEIKWVNTYFKLK
ncbi:MAG: hypothetical protein B1H07_01325 [Campylobacteraceae bacterium 4484_166]|nr:MAG: hypothetical protein B1H07_01325 [Campylobacteraceae bacterium 4484_166]